MKMIIFVAFVASTLFSCTDPKIEDKKEENIEVKEEDLTVEEIAQRQVEAQLSIPATENYKMEIHKAQFDEDGIEDAVILVNRAQYAEAEATRRNRYEKEAEMGFIGKYNHLFYFDGSTRKVTRPISISSSAFSPLKIKIENIHSNAYKDFTLDYRMIENCYRNFYTISHGVPKLVFQWPVFELENANNEKYHFIEYAPGTYSPAKDILIYAGSLETPKPSNLKTDFDYSISKKGGLEHLFFYNPNEGKYFTKK